MRVTRHNSCWVSPFGHPRINARLPTPQGISQAPTSFIGSRCQGIHHAPLPTCHTNHQHTQQTNTPRMPAARVNEQKNIDQDTNNQRYQHYKQTHPPKNNLVRVMLASTMKKSRNKKPNQPRTPHQGAPASDASDTQQRATQNHPPTHPHKESKPAGNCHHVPLVNTPNRSPTLASCHGVCSLERR